MRNRLFMLGLCFAIVGLGPGAVGAATPVAEGYTNYGDVVVELMSVERKGNVLTVKWAARNEGSEADKAFFGISGERVSYVVDEENGTKYYVLTDQEQNPIASANDWIDSDTNGINVKIEPGRTSRHWMKLPAPPPEVKAISVFLTETEPFEDVPITDR